MDLPFFSEGKKPRKWQDLRVTTFLAAMTFLQVERALDAEKCMRQRTHGGYSTGNTVPSRRLDKVEKLGRVDMRRKKAEITSTTQVILLHLGAVILPRLIAFLHSGFLFLHLESSYASSGAHYVKQ